MHYFVYLYLQDTCQSYSIFLAYINETREFNFLHAIN